MNFAVPVKMVFVNDNGNRSISGVFGCDFVWFYQKYLLHMFTSSTLFCFYLIYFLYEFRCPSENGFC